MTKQWARLALGGILLAAGWLWINLSPIHVVAQDLPTPTRFVPTIRLSLPPVLSPTTTPSRTFQPSATYTPSRTPTTTPSPTPSSTLTATPSQTPSATLTSTPTFTATVTETPSQTFTPSITLTPSATLTGTQTATATYTASVTPSVTPSDTATATNTPTDTATATLTDTPTLTATPTITLTPTATYTPSITPTRPPPVVERTRPDEGEGNSTPSLPPFLLVGGVLLTLIVGGYMVTYARRAAALDRYASGFVLYHCPACQEGILSGEERVDRLLGIPRVKRTVRCDTCRSVLREVGNRRWRYAIDPTANPELYEALNNQVLHEQELIDLSPDSPFETPHYIDEG